MSSTDEEKKLKKEQEKLEKEKKKLEKAQKLQAGGSKKNQTGLQFPKSNISAWYPDVLIKSELIDYYDISGCYIFRPWSFKMWELIQQFMNAEFAELGVENCYFPLFVTKEALESEAEHVEGFTPEVAWVTKSGKTDLEKPIAIRPTSETVMYPYYSKWVQSHKDLPLKLNQWCNVVRWEFKNPVPFIRGREFLWQEGHTAHATQAEAEKEVLEILDIYAKTYEELCAVPVTKGRKTEAEKFAGAYYTTTVEAFVAENGRSVQAGTSHCLGQNFSKMPLFKIEFEVKPGEKAYAWQNSWGFSTRSLGVITLVHGDDTGLILPPRIAPVQVVIVPIIKTTTDVKALMAYVKEVEKVIKKAGVRVHVDDREQYKPGWKYNFWELKGVPIRLDVGDMDIEKKCVMSCRRDTKDKKSIEFVNLGTDVKSILDDIHKTLFERAKKKRDDSRCVVTKWEDFVPALDTKKVCLVPFCGEIECEENIKKKSKIESEKRQKEKKDSVDSEDLSSLSGSGKSLCIPFEQNEIKDETCFCCGEKAKFWCLFGRSY